MGYDSLDRLSTASLNGASFSYGYDAVTGWLNKLAYPNGLVRNTEFHANLPLPASLTYVKGTSSTPALKHAYTWDNMRRPSVREDYVGSTAISRRHAYGYNSRGELTGDVMNAGGSFSYAYDNIGNRSTAAEQGTTSAYQSNNLNQYTTVTRAGTPFTPAYDADGNQTSVNTSTGTWSVQYNADNRPVVFTQGNRKVECVYDYLGRRVEKVEYDGNTLTQRTRFAYMGYLMIASMDCTQHTSNPALLGTWFWDPSEPVATRALAMCTHNADKSVSSTRYVAHDLLKSVSALFDSTGTRQGKFEYTPYGETLTSEGAWASAMPLRYSSEYRDEELGLIYYNYRHYNPRDGRWISRDPIEEEGRENLYEMLENCPNVKLDYLGLKEKNIDLDAADPPPGEKTCYGLLEPHPNKWDGTIKQKDIEALYEAVEKVNQITDKLGRRCYLVMIKATPLNTDAIKSLPGMANKSILSTHTKRQKNGFNLISGGKILSDKDIDPRVDVVGCHRGDHGSISQVGGLYLIIDKIKLIKEKDCCESIESILIATGTLADYPY